MDYLSQKEIPFGKILCIQNDYLIELNILFWYKKSKFSISNQTRL